MYAFEYHRPHTLSGALADLAKADAKALAGGMPLLPTMKQRLANPSAIIELKGVPELSGLTRDANDLVIGAMTRHVEVERSPVVKSAIPALAKLIGEKGEVMAIAFQAGASTSDQRQKGFEEEIKKYPTSTRAPDSMLKLGQSMIAMGQKKEGCIALGALQAKYPNAYRLA